MIELAEEEKVPVNEAITVLKQKTIYKKGKWWCAVVKGEQFGKTKTYLYLWIQDNGKWKRKQKFTVPSLKDWETIEQVVREFIG